MAEDLKDFALEKAELLSTRLKEALTLGNDYVRAQFGIDLDLKPELYPTWVILSTAAAGVLLVLCLSWAAVCGGLLAGKKRGSPITQGSSEPDKASVAKPAKPEEPKKRNRKKTLEKRAQSNGQPVTGAQEEVKAAEGVSKVAPQIKPEKVHEVLPPVQVKKNKKKAKAEVKPVQNVSTTDGKEPDDGAWETKVSNREKKQQRRKDKGPEDSGSPGGVDTPKTSVEAPVATAPTNTKKNKGNQGASSYLISSVSSSWREETSVNGGGWTDISMIPGQMGAMEGNKWSTIPATAHYRAPPKRESWAQDAQAAWGGIDGQMKSNLNPVSFTMLGRNTSDQISNSIELQWAGSPEVDDEWSGFNGTASADPSSDWNAPAEHWGNYEEPPVLLTSAPQPKEQPVSHKVSEDEKDTEDPSDGAAKSKKKRKKKKKTEEEATPESQMVSTMPLVDTVTKTQEPPVLASKKQNQSISSQKKSEPAMEPPKPSQKKKVRRET
ncbi:metadherin a isoform X1 [Xyrichtys novacula]|uniref:Metadherin a isoform X1 n=1 Tax=Xyrichtys novacula TaxID=13765 RepID=A0AAV1HC86_XYRNO|nr:metadherin a isoform X1 [Xyrichtys novacula]